MNFGSSGSITPGRWESACDLRMEYTQCPSFSLFMATWDKLHEQYGRSAGQADVGGGLRSDKGAAP